MNPTETPTQTPPAPTPAPTPEPPTPAPEPPASSPPPAGQAPTNPVASSSADSGGKNKMVYIVAGVLVLAIVIYFLAK